jgi:hypothetical protein
VISSNDTFTASIRYEHVSIMWLLFMFAPVLLPTLLHAAAAVSNLKQTTRSGVPLPLFKQMFGETTTQVVVDVRYGVCLLNRLARFWSDAQWVCTCLGTAFKLPSSLHWSHMPADWPASNYCAPGSMLISPCHPCLRACFHPCRCEVDGQKVPISQHTSGKLSDQATSCQAVLTYNPTSTSRRNVTVPQGVLSNKFMAGKVRQHLMLQ